MNALVYSGVDENAEYFKGLQGNDLDSQIKLFSEDLVQAWDMLTYAFETATSVEGRGLRLLPCYHESESRYDDVDGGFFMVENADQMSPAGKAFLAHIRHSGWVCYG